MRVLIERDFPAAYGLRKWLRSSLHIRVQIASDYVQMPISIRVPGTASHIGCVGESHWPARNASGDIIDRLERHVLSIPAPKMSPCRPVSTFRGGFGSRIQCWSVSTRRSPRCRKDRIQTVNVGWSWIFSPQLASPMVGARRRFRPMRSDAAVSTISERSAKRSSSSVPARVCVHPSNSE